MASLKYNTEDFINAFNDSSSIRQMLIKLGLKPAGGNYTVANKKIQELGLDKSHMLGQGHLKGKTHTWAKSIPLEEILTKDSIYYGGSYRLKNKLFKAGLFDKICYSCNLKCWLGEAIPLELEHINGDNRDNRIENLTILCPNCHAFTKTYRGKNKGKTI